MKKIFLSILYLTVFQLSAQNNKFSAEISPWFQNKPGAISISFDDASYTQYEYAYPVLEKYGLKATFGLVGEWTKENATYSAEPGMFQIKKMGWKEIRELQKKGYEIAAHGYLHQKYGKFLPVDTLVKQMKKIKNLIEAHTRKTVYTLHYPYSFTSDHIVSAANKSGFLFARTGDNFQYVSYGNFNPHLLYSQPILNDTIPNDKNFSTWLKNTKGKWMILMYHHLFPDSSKEMKIMRYHNVLHTYSLLPATFDRQMKMVAESGYWIAPEYQVGKYMIERLHTEIKLKKWCKTLYIKAKTDLDTQIYNQKLTILIRTPWHKIKILRKNKKEIQTLTDGLLSIDIYPGERLKIKKLSQ